MRILTIIICCLLTGCLPNTEDLSSFNTRINHQITYKADTTDYWQTPAETARLRTGDCEDYAIYKQFLLELGTVYLVYLDGVKPNPYHAVLVIHEMVLDNRYDKVQPRYNYTLITPLRNLRK